MQEKNLQFRMSKWKSIKVIEHEKVTKYELDEKERFKVKFSKNKARKLRDEISKLKNGMTQYQPSTTKDLTPYQTIVPQANPSLLPQQNSSSSNLLEQNSSSSILGQNSNENIFYDQNQSDYIVDDSFCDQDCLFSDEFFSNQNNDYFIIQDFESLNDVNFMF